MRVLLDECVPRPLRTQLAAHDVSNVLDMGWSGKRNGELLELMAAKRFDAFVTVDQKLPFQQALSKSRVGVVILVAKRNHVRHLLPLCPQLLKALDGIKPGNLIRIGG